MKYHDFHLRSYAVSDFGKRITLDLVNDLSSAPEVSSIEFTDVIAYHFVHTGGSIIIDISEDTFLRATNETRLSFSEAMNSLGGLSFWEADGAGYQRRFEEMGYRTWTIISAIGFVGFVVCKNVR